MCNVKLDEIEMINNTLVKDYHCSYSTSIGDDSFYAYILEMDTLSDYEDLDPADYKKFITPPGYSYEKVDYHDIAIIYEAGIKLVPDNEGEYYPIDVNKYHDICLRST